MKYNFNSTQNSWIFFHYEFSDSPDWLSNLFYLCICWNLNSHCTCFRNVADASEINEVEENWDLEDGEDDYFDPTCELKP